MLEAIRKQLEAMLQQGQSGSPAFDPSTLGDPVAMQTQWGPASGGGASFGTYELVEVDPFRVEFRSTGTSKLVSSFFTVWGPLAIAFSIVFIWITGGAIGLIAPGLLFMLVGVAAIVGSRRFMRHWFAPVVFDKRRGECWKGHATTDRATNRYRQASQPAMKLDDIHALQLVQERVRGRKKSYTSFELNLVFKDGKRSNIIDHGNLEMLRNDASRLGEFLKKPVWDAIG